MHFTQGVCAEVKCHEVEMPNSFTYLTWTPDFEWCVVTFASKNKHHRHIMCLKEFDYVFKICQSF